MATRTANRAAVTVQPKGLRVGLVAVTSTFSIGAGQSLSPGDVIQMVKIPARAKVISLDAYFDYAHQATFSVGDGDSDARYITNLTRSTGTGWVSINQLVPPYTYSIDDTIDIKVSLVSVSTILGGFGLRAIYSMDSQDD